MNNKIFATINIGEDFIVYLLILLFILILVIAVSKFIVLYFTIGSFKKVINKIESDKEEIFEDKGIYYNFYNFLIKNRLSPEALQELYEVEMIKIDKKLGSGDNFLATIGSNAPFIGLFGTVLGVITAFNGLAQGGGGNAQIMEGIAASLIATAMGLIVSLPAVFIFNFFKGKGDSIKKNLAIIFKLILSKRIENTIEKISENMVQFKKVS